MRFSNVCRHCDYMTGLINLIHLTDQKPNYDDLLWEDVYRFCKYTVRDVFLHLNCPPRGPGPGADGLKGHIETQRNTERHREKYKNNYHYNLSCFLLSLH